MGEGIGASEMKELVPERGTNYDWDLEYEQTYE